MNPFNLGSFDKKQTRLCNHRVASLIFCFCRWIANKFDKRRSTSPLEVKYFQRGVTPLVATAEKIIE
jgi:hypothetical protein